MVSTASRVRPRCPNQVTAATNTSNPSASDTRQAGWPLSNRPCTSALLSAAVAGRRGEIAHAVRAEDLHDVAVVHHRAQARKVRGSVVHRGGLLVVAYIK